MNNKKFMIRCDMEGVSGIVSYLQTEPDKAEYEFGKKMFMSDMLAMLEGLNDGGAEEIVIYDEHYYGRNVDLCMLPSNVSVICGKPPYRSDWAGGLDETFAGVLLLGFHSKFGTPGGLLHHSYEPDIKDIRLNHVSVGEIGMETTIAGHFNVPLLLVCGDSAAIHEAKLLVEDMGTVVVKESLNEFGGLCYPVAETTCRIKTAACDAAKGMFAAKPYKTATPVTMTIELNQGAFLETLRTVHSEIFTGDDCLKVIGSNAVEVWAAYWQMKLETRKRMGTE